MSTIIPRESLIYQSLSEAVSRSKMIVLCGLPGVGKSLYTLALNEIARDQNRNLDLIQWDLARKAFETKEILAKFPLGDGLVHNGVKLAVGSWLIDYLKNWIKENQEKSNRLLLIEAPFVGHRFVELAKVQDDHDLESFLSSAQSHFLCPIPSKEVRLKISLARKAQVKDDASQWIGAKPKVMQAIWEHLFEVAERLGLDLNKMEQSNYDPDIYDYVYRQVLKNRNYFALKANEIFDIPIKSEIELHQLENIVPSASQAARSCDLINGLFPTPSTMDELVGRWYLNES